MTTKILVWQEGEGGKKHKIEQVDFVWQEGEGGKKHTIKTPLSDLPQDIYITTRSPSDLPQDIYITTRLPSDLPQDIYNMGIFLVYAFITYIMFELYIFIKSTNSKSPFTNILQLYTVGFLLLYLYSIWDKFKHIKGSLTQILQIIAFNCCIGFVGYVLRFYSIPRTSTIIFSLLAFVGVLSGYIWGIVFAKERISWLSILGSILITFSVAIKNYIRPAGITI